MNTITIKVQGTSNAQSIFDLFAGSDKERIKWKELSGAWHELTLTTDDSSLSVKRFILACFPSIHNLRVIGTGGGLIIK